MTNDLRASTTSTNEAIKSGAYGLASDPTKTFIPPSIEEPVPHFNFAPVENAIERVRAEATLFDEMLQTSSTEDFSRVNEILGQQEARLSDDAGLPGRPWFTHTIYAPGFYTGYGVKTLPGIREAIEQRQFHLVDDQMTRIAMSLEEYADGIKMARQSIE
jgi:N-acetylated-alpha-linked acidic dipeptidase